MKEQDILQNIMIDLKHLKAFMATFSQEASKDVQPYVDDAYNEFTQLQRNYYDLMVEEGYIKVQYQTKSALEKEYNKFATKEC